MKKAVAIVQSNYIPWKGYFDLINLVDEFILFDDVQYTVRDWRNRNLIKTPQGPAWLTIPVQTKGLRLQRIRDAVVSDSLWPGNHWQVLRHNYAHAANFAQEREFVEGVYATVPGPALSAINRHFIESLCQRLGIHTLITTSMDYKVVAGKTERLVSLCLQAGADTYISGPSAGAYMDVGAFRKEGIEPRYIRYDGYPEYDQLFPPFDHCVSILDVLLNAGSTSPQLLNTFRLSPSSPMLSAADRHEVIMGLTRSA